METYGDSTSLTIASSNNQRALSTLWPLSFNPIISQTIIRSPNPTWSKFMKEGIRLATSTIVMKDQALSRENIEINQATELLFGYQLN